MANPKVLFDIQIGDRPKGRILMDLFADVALRTVENFRTLCTGNKGTERSGWKFHCVIPGFMCQGGDFTRGDGTDEESIYGSKFSDESFLKKYTGAGILSMASAGPNTNGSQLFMCTEATAWLDGKHVVFRQAIEGMDVMREVENVGSCSGKTSKPVVIGDCGQVA